MSVPTPTPITVQSSLPVFGINPYPSFPVNGLFDSVNNIVGFNTPTGAAGSSTSFVDILTDPTKIVGSITAPYMPMNLSSYIPTIYQNIQSINSNLINTITAADLSRNYPTSYAVQQYVQSQLTGSQLITFACISTDNSTTAGSVAISNNLTNTLITLNTSQGFSTQTDNGTNYHLYMFPAISTSNSVRNGSSKTVLFNGDFTDNCGNLIPYIDLGPNDRFISQGIAYQYYQFTYKGDYISYVQVFDSGYWKFMVTSYQSSLSNGYQYTPEGGSQYNYFAINDSSNFIPSSAPFYGY